MHGACFECVVLAGECLRYSTMDDEETLLLDLELDIKEFEEGEEELESLRINSVYTTMRFLNKK